MVTAYVISIVSALVCLLIAALISNAIKFEGGANPKDPAKRKLWFWVMGILTPVIGFGIGFAMKPTKNQMEADKFTSALFIGIAVAFILYILLGFVLSKMFKNGKLGNWF
jgi:sulfoxide reductase heme-binding subunit YedZ